MISKQKGTYDLYGEEARKVLALRNIFENIMNNFNYSFIRTPVFESTELFKRTSGETSDVVSKEMYEFKDKKDRSLALRPEGTASVAISYIQIFQENFGILNLCIDMIDHKREDIENIFNLVVKHMEVMMLESMLKLSVFHIICLKH